jgi:hypothetical protein
LVPNAGVADGGLAVLRLLADRRDELSQACG